MFGNVPSVLASGRQLVFFHNVNYLDKNWRQESRRNYLEYIYFFTAVTLTTALNNKLTWAFQTRHVEASFLKCFPESNTTVIGHPIIHTNISKKDNIKSNNYLFYPSHSEKYKNHSFLSACAPLLRTQFGMDVICTTDDIQNVTNVGRLSHHDTISKLRDCKALIFPSRRESLGVPLMEAAVLGKPIVAPTLQYVQEVVSNIYYYDEDSTSSLINAVSQLLNDEQRQQLKSPSIVIKHDPERFINNILSVLEGSSK